jgi:PRTRC genetic system protein B
LENLKMDQTPPPLEVTIRLTPELPPEITVVDENSVRRAWFARLEDLLAVFREQRRPALRQLPTHLIATDLESCSVWLRPAGCERLLLALPERTALLAAPMPPLLLAARENGSLAVMALAGDGRPGPETPLYQTPLPNIGSIGAVCLGSTERQAFDPLDESAPWKAFWGSAFSSHQVAGRSQRHSEDVRLLLLELDGQEKYPTGDLVPAELSLAGWLAALGDGP